MVQVREFVICRERYMSAFAKLWVLHFYTRTLPNIADIPILPHLIQPLVRLGFALGLLLHEDAPPGGRRAAS